MQDTILTEIFEWSATLAEWQRDALRRLFTVGSLSAADIDELLELCKGKHGLTPSQGSTPLREEHLAIGNVGVLPVSLVSVTHHRGVNALAPEQTVGFGPSLTIVYGQNAAGKSGYIRILKRACRSRFTEDILGNVLSDGAPLRAHATIRFRIGDKQRAITWSPDAAPTGALAAVSVFDAHCAPIYLREKTDVAFRPFSLDVFDRLSNACAELRKALEVEKLALSSAMPTLPKVTEGTRVEVLFKNLTSLTKPDDVRALATISSSEEDRLKGLRAQQRDLQVSDPKKRAQELDLKASRAESVANHLTKLGTTLSDSALEVLRSSSGALTASRAALAHLLQAVLTPDLLPGTGEEQWRALWDSASDFSLVVYPNKNFPFTAAEAKCVLCQQPIGKDAAVRFKHFQELVTSSAHANVRAAEKAYTENLNAITRVEVQREDITLAIDEIHTDDEALAERARTCLQQSQVTKQAVAHAVSENGPLPTQGVQACPDADLRSWAKTLRERAAQLRKKAPSMNVKDVAELSELEARVALKDHLGTVIDEIERRKRVAAYSHCIDDTNTQSITRKSTELTKRLITKRLRDEFRSELENLDFTDLAVEISAAGGVRGALFHQLIFSNAPGVVVARVLSEGESRTLSLAAFLAELSTAPVSSAIIFDDPVSSLDHIWRERIARRLVSEAKSRQVIVFTHDLVFLKLLLDECERQNVAPQHQYIRRGDESSGLSSADLPWVAMRVRERIGVLRQRWQLAEKLSRTKGPDDYEREAREIYGLLREAWEQAVGEVLLNDVIERYRPSIETKKVKRLSDITEEDCSAMEGAMTECSRWIRGHDHPPADATPFPQPAELSKRIDELDTWVQGIRKRRS